MKKTTFVFFGTPDYVLPILSEIYKTYHITKGESEIVAVVTQKPQATGRKKFIERTAVDNWAYKHKLPVIYDPREVPEASIGIVASYGVIIPENVIKRFTHGILNIHPSLLPKYRGASPIQAAILAGDEMTGVTIIQMDSQMDHGPIITQATEPILPTETAQDLRIKLFERASDVLLELLPSYMTGKINPKPQDHEKAVMVRLVAKEHGFIPPQFLTNALEGIAPVKDWEIAFVNDLKLSPTPQVFVRLIRAMEPWPGVWTFVYPHGDEKRRLKILKAHVEGEKLVLDSVQLEGRSVVTFKEFVAGYPNHIFKN